MKKLLFLSLLILGLSLKAEQPKHVILKSGLSPYFENGLMNLTIGAVTSKNTYIALETMFGTGKKTVDIVDPYNWYGYGNNIYYGYLINKVYFSGLIGIINSSKNYDSRTQNNVIKLNYGGEIGLILGGITVSSSYSIPIGLTFKVGFLIDKL